MLRSLKIENYALIKSLSIDFDKGFSVITGETGAGKSILLGALALVLGERADTQVMDKEKKCIIEAVFDIKVLGLHIFFNENDLDYYDEVTIRRELVQSKTRAFINDTPVSLTVLKTLGEKLIDIHSQHETLTLKDSRFRLSLIDMMIEKPELLTEYKTIFAQYRTDKKALEDLQEQEKIYLQEKDYSQFIFDELNDCKLINGEQEEMEDALEIMNNAEEISTTLTDVSNAMNMTDGSVVEHLAEIITRLKKIAKYQNYQDIIDRVNTVYIEVKDIADEIVGCSENMDFDSQKKQLFTERLDKIYQLESKHRVKTIAELLEIQMQLSEKLLQTEQFSDLISAYKIKVAEEVAGLEILAGAISELRKNSAKKIETEVTNVLMELGMKAAYIKIDFTFLDNLTDTGKDSVRFLFSANQGAEPRELSKIASGGEMSRLMLAIKSVITHSTFLPTIIFDEIDTGVSGDIASKVGIIMKKMSDVMQVIAISHLPQIAAKADTHYLVYKSIFENRTISNIKKLTEDERIEAVASMISNDKITETYRSAAKDLINNI